MDLRQIATIKNYDKGMIYVPILVNGRVISPFREDFILTKLRKKKLAKISEFTVYLNAIKRNNLTSIIFPRIIWASSFRVCEQHRRRPACASAQSDQRLCYSFFGKYHM